MPATAFTIRLWARFASLAKASLFRRLLSFPTKRCFAGALNCYPLGLWLSRSIIVPICRHRHKVAILFYNVSILSLVHLIGHPEKQFAFWEEEEQLYKWAFAFMQKRISNCLFRRRLGVLIVRLWHIGMYLFPYILHRRYLACFLCNKRIYLPLISKQKKLLKMDG